MTHEKEPHGSSRADMLLGIKKLFEKKKEFILYLAFGAGTTAVDLATSYSLYPTGLNIHVVHVIAWVLAVTFAYVTNKIYVFGSKAKGISIVFEILKFYGSRLATLVLQEAIVFILFDCMKLSEYLVKIPATVVVVILNYLFSKLIVFRGGKKHE